MADLSDTQAAAPVKIIGSRSSDATFYPLNIYSSGVSCLPAVIGTKTKLGRTTLLATSSTEVSVTQINRWFTTNTLHEVVGASANDTWGGTGVNSVTVEFLDQNGDGPFFETVQLNGLTGVDLSSTNICYVSDFYTEVRGSSGGGATLRRFDGSFTVAVISGETSPGTGTYRTHHLVPNGKTCYITDFHVAFDNNTAGLYAQFAIYYTPLLVPQLGVPSQRMYQASSTITVISGQNSNPISYKTPIAIPGPATIVVVGTNPSITSLSASATYSYIEV